MEIPLKVHTYTFKPTAYNTDEKGATARKVMSVRRGTWILAVALRVGVLFNGTVTIDIGDKVVDARGDIDGFMTNAQAAIGTAGLKAGYGAYFTSGKSRLYTDVDMVDGRNTIDITYDYTADTIQGECTVIIVYADLE